MTPEQLHRKKLKELGYNDEVIEEFVLKYIKNCTYEFAESYHTEQSKLFGVGIELPTELEVRSECVDYLYKFERENKMLGKSTLVRRGIEIGFIECHKWLKSNGN